MSKSGEEGESDVEDEDDFVASSSSRGPRSRPRVGAGKDLLDDVSVEDLMEEDPDLASIGIDELSSARADGDGDSPRRVSELARRMWRLARAGNRDERVWARYSQRVLTSSAMIGAMDVVLIFQAFARIKYRNKKVLDALTPFLLRHVDEFSLQDLALLLNAHKKLEFERVDNIRLLLGALCAKHEDWLGRTIALAANAVAFFYVYEPRFWKMVGHSLHKLVWTMNPLELSNLVSAMARVDRRDGRALVLIARMCRRCAARHLFSQETLAVTMNAFAKLDFNHVKLAKVFEDAAVVKIDQALALGPDYRKSSLWGVDVFDVQALVMVTHSLVCLVGTSDEVIEKLLTLVTWSSKEVGNYQRRALKTTCLVLRRQHRELLARVRPEVRDALYIFEKAPVKVAAFESRWCAEVRRTLVKMGIKAEAKSIVDDQMFDIYLPASKAAVYPIGPYGHYANTTHRTALSKLHQRLLEMEGYTCLTVPYYEWSELKTEEDKMVYLWSLGRRAAARKEEARDGADGRGVFSAEAAPYFAPESDLQSDCGEIGEHGL